MKTEIETELNLSTNIENGNHVNVRLIEDEDDWRKKLRRGDKGSLKSLLGNVVLILENALVSPFIFVRNTFSNRDYYGINSPWGGRKGDELKDDDAIRLKHWLSSKYKFEPNTGLIYEAMAIIAIKNSFHPVQDWLKSLQWDGQARLDSWMKKYLHATGPEPYLTEVSRKFLLASVARVFNPGTKFDSILIFEGPQGIGKSSAACILASELWFCDNLPDLRSPDARLNLQGKWFVELSELANLKHGDVETIKSFISAKQDRVRPPYGRRAVDYQRQCVFIGTTNDFGYLKDKTGNRRFWPVTVGRCNQDALTRDRDQLFAEAFSNWQLSNEKLYLETKAYDQAMEVQRERVGDDEESMMMDVFEEFLESAQNGDTGIDLNGRFKLAQMFDLGGPFSDDKRWRQDTLHIRFAAKILNSHGFEKFLSGGRSFWRKKAKK